MRRFWIIATAILLWNLIGDAAYLMQATADLDAIAGTDPVTAAALHSMPAWAWAAYAVAVGGGTLGAVLLLMRRKAAWALFALSLAGVVVLFGWSFLGFDMVAAKGWSSAIFPAVIFAIALASLLYARAKAADGMLQ
ncbi:sugar transporter [Novosphingobium sp. BL-52-GroH]|uniref:sugar transporter n=1 Tax=Novosphingobium sp. BL-52-GroH TaxID=3349877 RepID=UPI00384E3DAD